MFLQAELVSSVRSVLSQKKAPGARD